MEAALGNKDLAREDTERASLIANAVKSLCWSKEYGLLSDTPEKTHFSQHGNAFAVWLDVIPKDKQKAVMIKIMSASDPAFTAEGVPAKLSLASYYYRFYLARALVHSGLGARYLETLGPWKAMVSNGLTTWAEQPEPTRSDSHAWSAHPNYDLLTIVAGITPTSPNFKSVRIEPRLGSLKHVDAALSSPSGLIALIVDIETRQTEATVTIPDGMNGTFIWNGREYPLIAGKQQLSLPISPGGR
jgi:hypothetical protein